MSASERLERLDREATPGPWTFDPVEEKKEPHGLVYGPLFYGPPAAYWLGRPDHPDARLIASLRAVLPEIIAVVRAAEQLQIPTFESNAWYDVYENLPDLLADLDLKLEEK